MSKPTPSEIVDPHDDLTIASYDAHALIYRERTEKLTEQGRELITDFAALVGVGARVLEIGSGGGRDADAMEAAGLSVRRTDITPEFVALLRADGHQAEILDPLRDDLVDPARPGQSHDAIWTSACLHHVQRADLPQVLTRLGSATRPGGVIYLSVKDGVGEEWVSQGNIEAPRLFVYWNEDTMRSALETAGWKVDRVSVRGSAHGHQRWLHVWASRMAS